MNAITQFKAARRVSAPIVVLRTADQYAAVESLRKTFNGSAPALLTWDIARGMLALNDQGQDAFNDLGVDPTATINPVEAISIALKLPERAILFLYNAHRIIGTGPDTAGVSQAIWNCREEYKTDGRTLVLLAPDLTLPAELANDALVIDVALPTEAELSSIIVDQLNAAGIRATVDDPTLTKAVDAVAGLAAFPAEQAVAMSLSPTGIDLAGLWERKRQAIEQAPGLSVWRGGETLDDLGGLANLKQFGRRVLNGNDKPRCIVFIDELEKAMAGTQGDTSGVSQEMHGTMLSWMVNNDITGIILVSPPGTGKSAFAKSLGNESGIPTITFDFTAMKGSLVGESGRNLRTALGVVDAVSQGKVLIVATCNSISSLSPELRSRFTMGTFYVDLPTAEERETIWFIWTAKFKLRGDQFKTRPKDEGWTGREIRNCCSIAYRLNITLVEAASYIVPVVKSAAESIAKLREQANGRFISAAEPGVYQAAKLPARSTARAFNEG